MATKSPTMGKLIILEGPDGAEKASISEDIAKHLTNRGYPCEQMATPSKGLGVASQLVYEHHYIPSKHKAGGVSTTSKQVPHDIAHINVIECCILPALQSGRSVVLDRFWWSTWVYGIASGVERKFLESLIDLERKQWQSITPTAVLLLRWQPLVQQNSEYEYWETLSHEYDALAEKEQSCYPVFPINRGASLEDAIDLVKTIVDKSLNFQRQKKQDKHSSSSEQLSLNFNDYSESKASQTPRIVYSHLLPAKPTVVFDTYWRFAAERQKVFFKKLLGQAVQWTDDPILSTFKFTNAYRASDRVSQYLIRHVIYRNDLPESPEEVFFRIILFKLFNKIETWQLLEKTLGHVIYQEYSFNRYDQILTEVIEQGRTIYSAAYIMPSGGKVFGHARKHRNHLKLIEQMMADGLPKKLMDVPTMLRGFELLRGYPTIGDFLAYQFITDVNYSNLTNFSEMSFVVPGPGALDGIRKCFADLGGLSEPEIIKHMADNQQSEFERLGLDFPSLFGRPLQLIDCQNLFCEVDKYARMRHPEVSGISGRTRIKQKYSAQGGQIEYWYPPKWGINDSVKNYLQQHRGNVSTQTKL